MITQTTSDSTTTAALLAKPVGADASTRRFDPRERIHRFAGAVHRAIDSVEQTLDSRSRGVVSSKDKYGEQARQYGDKVRERINSQPLQSAAIAVGTGVILDKLFFTRSRPKVRVVHVPAYTRPSWEPSASVERPARRWMDTAGSYMHGLRASGQEAAGKVGAAAGLGLASAESAASTLARKASTVPLQVRLATQRLLARSQEYGSMARSEVQARPLVGVGAMLGAGALLTTLWLQRRRAEPGMAYVTAVEEKGNGVTWQSERVDLEPRGMISSRPVTSAVVALGLGAVIGAMLRRP